MKLIHRITNSEVDNDIPGLYTQTHHGIDFDTTDYSSTQHLFKDFQWEKPSPLTSTSQLLICERGEWRSRWDLRSCLFAIAVGLGNIWMFSSTLLSMINDKTTSVGSFLIAYVISWVLIGYPVVVLELFLGFLCSRSVMASWKCVPILKGVGVVQFLVSIYLCAVYVSIITWAVTIVISTNFSWRNLKDDFLNESIEISNGSLNQNFLDWNVSAEFLRQNVYNTTQPIGDIPEIKWIPLVILTATIIIIVMITVTGINIFGKILGFFSLGILSALIAFFVISVMNNSQFFDNISKLLQASSWEELMESQIWFTAVAQVLFSVLGGSGSLISLGSFASRNIPLISSAFLFCCLSFVTSIICAMLILSSVGPELPIALEKSTLLIQESDLALISWHVQFSSLDRESILWISIGFTVIALSGIGCCVAILNSWFTTTRDCSSLSKQRSYGFQAIFTVGVFVVALPCILQCGLKVLNLICTYGINPLLLICALIQCSAVCWIYGPRKYFVDLTFVSSDRPIVKVTAYVTMFTPIVIMALLIWSAVQIRIPILPEPSFPWWVDVLGFLLVGIGAMSIIVIGILVICKQDDYGAIQMVQSAIKPSMEWGPPDPLVRNEWLNWKTDHFLMGRSPNINDTPKGSLASIEMKSTGNGAYDDNTTLPREDL